MKHALFLVLAFGLSGAAHAADKKPVGGPCVLAPALRHAVQERFGSARVLSATDLFEDERKLFIEAHKAACPGLRTGHFFGSKAQTRPATALVLLDIGPKKEARLIVARPAGKTWVFVEVQTMDSGSTAVISTEGPGSYKDETRTLTAKDDVVVLTGYGSWRRVYVWNGKTFDSVKTTD
ncbi:MAG: hypothetical protein ABI672_09420 [Vicinamibacteria bacterium]